MRFLLLCAAVLSALTPNAYAAEWPKAPWRPYLIYSSNTESRLCGDFEKVVVAEYFNNHPDAPRLVSQNDSFSDYEPQGLGAFLGLEKSDLLDFKSSIYQLDFDGDSAPETIISFRNGGSNNVDYQYYFQLYKLSGNRLSQLQNELKAAESNEEYDSRSREIWRSFWNEFSLPSQKIYPDKSFYRLPVKDRINAARSTAYPLSNKFRVRTYKGRAFVDVTGPRNTLSDRILLSFNTSLEPKAECIVALQPAISEYIQENFPKSSFLRILDAAQNVTGRRTRCYSGTSKPFYYHDLAHENFLEEALLRPWSFLSDQKQTHWYRYKEKKLRLARSDDYFDQYQYYWSLLGAYNRRNYNLFDAKIEEAAAELEKYYVSNFEVNDMDFEAFSKSIIQIIRTMSSSAGDYAFSFYNQPEILLRIHGGTATENDFVAFAASTNTNALSLAANANASDPVLAALLDYGEEVDSGNESALLSAIDLTGPRRFLLDRGADPNRPNYYGKTPLMMAAHMNNHEAVLDLIAAGSDVNLKTFLVLKGEDKQQRNNPDWLQACQYKINYRERTALMYAAENSSLDLIKTLLAAGADASAMDSRGRGMLDYLSTNELLSATNHKRAKNLLIEAGANP